LEEAEQFFRRRQKQVAKIVHCGEYLFLRNEHSGLPRPCSSHVCNRTRD